MSDLADQLRPGLGATGNTVVGWADAAANYQDVSEQAYKATDPLWRPHPANEGIADIYDDYNRMKTPTGQRLMGFAY